MGLDMFLTKETTFFRNSTENIQTGIDHIQPKRIIKIIEELCYWRKANAIHDWFVQNCQNGVDECQKTYIRLDDLEKLYSIVCEILDTPELDSDEITETSKESRDEVALRLLPPAQGFFFGSDKIDEYYYEDLQSTREALEKIIQELCQDFNDEDVYIDLYYQSSW